MLDVSTIAEEFHRRFGSLLTRYSTHDAMVSVDDLADYSADIRDYVDDGLKALGAELRGERERRIQLEAALASNARVETILKALLVSRDDPEDGTHDHLPRVLRDFLSVENGKAGNIGFHDGHVEGCAVGFEKGYAKAKADAASLTEPLDALLGVASDALEMGFFQVAETIQKAVREIQLRKGQKRQE